MIDLDHFKTVNDSLGHAAGDAVLREAARRMSSAIREYDVIGRIGGEEFLVIAPEIDRQGLMDLGERLRDSIASQPAGTREGEIQMTISVGVTLAGPSDKVDRAVGTADAALYVAKEKGRDRVEFQVVLPDSREP
jgi:two-component system chemotaxis response regulator CheY